MPKKTVETESELDSSEPVEIVETPADPDPDGVQAVLEMGDGSYVLAGVPHDRRRLLTINGQEWLHKADDARGRWIYRRD